MLILYVGELRNFTVHDTDISIRNFPVSHLPRNGTGKSTK
jgi:hypothetical protein